MTWDKQPWVDQLEATVWRLEREKAMLRKALRACDQGANNWWCGGSPLASYKYIQGIVKAALNKTDGWRA